jgi:hypothetical protein
MVRWGYNMNKKTRLIILLFCVVCFLAVAPILVAYSMGYRFDFENRKIVATGGIYVRTFPTAEQITVDSNIFEKPGLFANSIFVQSLLPKSHTVLIKKTGYYDYSKILEVQENQVTKLENVLLIKDNITFTNITDDVSFFSVAPNSHSIITGTSGTKNTTFNYFSLNNPTETPKTFSVPQIGNASVKWSNDSNIALISLQNSVNTYYYFFDSTTSKPTAIRLSYLDKNSELIDFNHQDPKIIFYVKDNTLYSASGNNSLPIINNLISFKVSNSNIVWLSTKGALLNSDFSGKLISQISAENFAVNTKKHYEILLIQGNTYLKDNDSLLEFNQAKKVFEEFPTPAISNYEILVSPDNKNLIFQNSDKILIYSSDITKLGAEKTFEEIFSGIQITNLQWLNNDYIIFIANGKAIISEIDYRGNINFITFPQTTLSMFFNQQTGKLYILSGNSILVSEKITP